MKTITTLGMVAVLVGCTAQAANTVPSPEPTPGIAGRLIFVDLADSEHGIALVGQCTEKPFRCRQRVAVLDGGTQWRLRSSPLADFTNPTAGFSAEVVALAPGLAVISSPPDNLVGTTRWRHWFTRDAARTWREVSIKATDTTTTIPEGARLIADVLDPDADDVTDPEPGYKTPRILVIDPATGRRKVLAQQPPLREPRVASGVPAYDGGWWVSGKDPRTGEAAVAVTRDSGLSWTSSRLGDVGNVWHTSVLAGPDASYAVVKGELPANEQVKNGLVAVFRSTDGGRNWQRTWAFRPGREPRSSLSEILASDGSLRVITETPGSYLSRDGGRTFAPVSGEQGNVQHTRAGYLLTHNETGYQLSADGLTWRTVTVIQG